MTIRAGDMRHRVRIEERSTTQDAAGEPASEWSEVAEVWAALERTPGTEVWASAQRQGRVPVVFRIRYRDDVLPAMRAVLVGERERVHDIRSALDPSGKRAEMLLVCEERVEDVP